jgi:hypothetical protein
MKPENVGPGGTLWLWSEVKRGAGIVRIAAEPPLQIIDGYRVQEVRVNAVQDGPMLEHEGNGILHENYRLREAVRGLLRSEDVSESDHETDREYARTVLGENPITRTEPQR